MIVDLRKENRSMDVWNMKQVLQLNRDIRFDILAMISQMWPDDSVDLFQIYLKCAVLKRNTEQEI
jgi:hypothetical protein